jgi:hypothetical protein
LTSCAGHLGALPGEATAERARHQIDLDRANRLTRLSRDHIASLVTQLSDLAQLLRQADPRDRTEIYTQLGLRLTYHHEKRLVTAEARPDQACTTSCVRGPTHALSTWPTPSAEITLA